MISRPPGRWKVSRPALRSGPLETPTTGTSWTPASSSTSQTAESWPLPPSISSRSGHSPLRAVRILLLEPGEAAAEHLAHHREIVARARSRAA